mgnify:CR=1 FL=1|tara:strand:+ start:3050 stop:4159 length:1110 start_codon:yes stop_codon:yes gene_type:complete
MKIGFVGDICLSSIDKKFELNKEIINNLQFSEISNLLKVNNYNIGNLECPITNSSEKIEKIGPHLKVDLGSYDFFESLNINCLSLANNHIKDYGIDGLIDTIDYLKKRNIKYAGNVTEGINNYYFTIKENDVSLAVICCAEDEFNSSLDDEFGTNSINPVSVFYQINELKKHHDHVLVYPHGGNEYSKYPSLKTRNLYRFYIDCGASAVIGNHTHIIQGFEIYLNCPIFYSLGNFFFPFLSDNKGLLVNFNISKNELSFEIYFTIQNFLDFSIDFLKNSELKIAKDKLNKISQVITSDVDLQKKNLIYLQQRRNSYLNIFFPFNKYIVAFLRRTNIIDVKYFKNYLLRILNNIRCQSHLDNLIKILKNK